MHGELEKLQGGDRRSIGRAEEVAADDLDDLDVDRAVAVLSGSLDDESCIVHVNAMSALTDLALANPRFRETVGERIEELVDGGSPAVQARGREPLDALASAE